jgi:hypothetical protein
MVLECLAPTLYEQPNSKRAVEHVQPIFLLFDSSNLHVEGLWMLWWWGAWHIRH